MIRQFFKFSFIAATLAVLLALGTWQLERLQWKEQKIERYTSAQQTAAVPLLDILQQSEADLPSLQYRRITLSGTYLHDKELHLGGRRYYGNTGYEIHTPLKLANGQYILVNRGWVPTEFKDPTDRPTDEFPASIKNATAMIRIPKEPGIFTPDNHPEKNFWFTVDIAAMEAQTGLPLTPFTANLISPERERTDFPAPSDGKVVLRNDHLGYAITWFLLAIGAAIIFWLVLRNEKKAKS